MQAAGPPIADKAVRAFKALRSTEFVLTTADKFLNDAPQFDDVTLLITQKQTYEVSQTS